MSRIGNDATGDRGDRGSGMNEPEADLYKELLTYAANAIARQVPIVQDRFETGMRKAARILNAINSSREALAKTLKNQERKPQ